MLRSVLRRLATGLLVAVMLVAALPTLAAGEPEQRGARSEISAVEALWSWISEVVERWPGWEKAGPEIAPDGQPHAAVGCAPEVACTHAGPEIAPDG